MTDHDCFPKDQKSEMKAYALIPARSGSWGVPDKNIAKLGSVTLIGHAVEFGRKLPVERVICSTDSSVYAAVAKAHGADVPCLRGKRASRDDAREEDILADLHATLPGHGLDMPDVWVWLKPTSPFRRVASVERALNLIDPNNDFDWCDSVRVVSSADARLQVLDDGMLYAFLDETDWPHDISKIPRTRAPAVVKPYNLEVFFHQGWRARGAGFMGDKIAAVVDHPVTGLDIDCAEDLEIVRAVADAYYAGKAPWLEEYIHG